MKALALFGRTAAIAAALAVSVGLTTPASAESVVKFGIVGPFSGASALNGEQWKQGVQAWLSLNGDTVNGRKIEILYRDTASGNPAVAKQLTQELLVQDKVDVLGGYALSPEAAGAAPLVNETKTPTLLFHVASPVLTKLSPYFIRVGQNIAQNGSGAAKYALRHGKKTAFVTVADYAPGKDVLKAFSETFTKGGGTIVGQQLVPLTTVDFAPVAEHIAQTHAEWVQLFLPPGATSVGAMKAFAARGLLKKVQIVGQGEAEDSDMSLFGDSVEGFYSYNYNSGAVNNPENAKFREALKKLFGASTEPSSFSLGGYDAMELLAQMIRSQKGASFSSDNAMAGILGYSWKSPRGPVTIDKTTREPVQNFYFRRVERQPDGTLRNIIIDAVPPDQQ
jgi:branched-chain amino acid transport system substrate-binding protein